MLDMKKFADFFPLQLQVFVECRVRQIWRLCLLYTYIHTYIHAYIHGPSAYLRVPVYELQHELIVTFQICTYMAYEKVHF
jgi:hypothetical protein